MIEPEEIPGVHADEGVIYRFGELGHVSVYADGHIRFVAKQGLTLSHCVNHSDRPGEVTVVIKFVDDDTEPLVTG